MCCGAFFWNQISQIVYGDKDDKRGYSLYNQSIIHPKTKVIGGIVADPCRDLIRDFFQRKRG